MRSRIKSFFRILFGARPLSLLALVGPALLMFLVLRQARELEPNKAYALYNFAFSWLMAFSGILLVLSYEMILVGHDGDDLIWLAIRKQKFYQALHIVFLMFLLLIIFSPLHCLGRHYGIAPRGSFSNTAYMTFFIITIEHFFISLFRTPSIVTAFLIAYLFFCVIVPPNTVPDFLLLIKSSSQNFGEGPIFIAYLGISVLLLLFSEWIKQRRFCS